MQKLILPFKTNMIICGYKNKMYKRDWGYPHYGIDITATQGIQHMKLESTIYASGDGKVIDCGYDNSGGNIVIIKYYDVYIEEGKSQDLIARYYHLANNTTKVKKGQIVNIFTPLGDEGTTPKTSIHLHLEFDTDINYPYHSPQVSSRDDKKTRAEGNILKKGTDTTISPMKILYATNDRLMIPSVFNPEYYEPYENTIEIIDTDINTQITDFEKGYKTGVKHCLDFLNELDEKLNHTIENIKKQLLEE